MITIKVNYEQFNLIVAALRTAEGQAAQLATDLHKIGLRDAQVIANKHSTDCNYLASDLLEGRHTFNR